MLSKLDGRAWRWLSPAAADGFEPVFSRSWGPDAPSRPGRAAGSCPRWESSKANLIWTRVCSHQYHQLVQAEHSVYPVKYRDTWYLCPLGNPDIARINSECSSRKRCSKARPVPDNSRGDFNVLVGIAGCNQIGYTYCRGDQELSAQRARTLLRHRKQTRDPGETRRPTAADSRPIERRR